MIDFTRDRGEDHRQAAAAADSGTKFKLEDAAETTLMPTSLYPWGTEGTAQYPPRLLLTRRMHKMVLPITSISIGDN